MTDRLVGVLGWAAPACPRHGVREVLGRDPSLAQHLAGDPVVEIHRGEQQVLRPRRGFPVPVGLVLRDCEQPLHEPDGVAHRSQPAQHRNLLLGYFNATVAVPVAEVHGDDVRAGG